MNRYVFPLLLLATACVSRQESISNLREGAWDLPQGFTPSFGDARGFDCVGEKTKTTYEIRAIDREAARAQLTLKTPAAGTAASSPMKTIALYILADGYFAHGDDRWHQPVNSIVIDKPTGKRAKGVADENYGETLKEMLSCSVVSGK